MEAYRKGLTNEVMKLKWEMLKQMVSLTKWLVT
jgi:hypothetical protein